MINKWYYWKLQKSDERYEFEKTQTCYSRLANIFGNGTIYRHNKKIEKGKNSRNKPNKLNHKLIERLQFGDKSNVSTRQRARTLAALFSDISAFVGILNQAHL